MKLAIAGAAGRMGRVLTRIVHETKSAELAGGLESKGSSQIGADMGELAGLGKLGVMISDDAGFAYSGMSTAFSISPCLRRASRSLRSRREERYRPRDRNDRHR